MSRAIAPALLRQINNLLDRYTDLAIVPSREDSILLRGRLSFAAEHHTTQQVSDSFDLEISVPRSFPSDLPSVRELAGRIPQSFHRLADGALCLGSPLRLKAELAKAPNLTDFVERCVIPYLFGFSVSQSGGELPFKELNHGLPGLLDDYELFLGTRNAEEVMGFLLLLGFRKRVANKRMCPCRNGLRFGRCHSPKLNVLRQLATRRWYRGHATQMATMHARATVRK